MARLRPACPARVIHPRVIKVPAANPAAAVVAEKAAAEKVAAVQQAVMNLYREAAARLSTFPCSCTRRELQAYGGGPYPGICADTPADPSRPLALRWRTEPGWTRFEDGCAGLVEENVEEAVGACTLRRTDGVWSYQLAVAVDDLRMGMTHILRGADLLNSTPRQLAMMRAVCRAERGTDESWEPPQYAHVPVLYGEDGQKLSKRHGAPDLRALREGGADPRRVVAMLGRTMGMLPADTPRATPKDVLSAFRLGLAAQAPRTLTPALAAEFHDLLGDTAAL